MTTRSLFTRILILLGLMLSAAASYAFARLLPDPGPRPVSGQPPLARLDLPPQTVNGYTAAVESYYADAGRFLFQVRVTGKKTAYLDRVSLKDQGGEEINASMGYGPAGAADPSVSLIDFTPVVPLMDARFQGMLTFGLTTSPGEGEALATFTFDLDFPIQPALTFTPKQSVHASGVEILPAGSVRSSSRMNRMDSRTSSTRTQARAWASPEMSTGTFTAIRS